MLSRATQDAGDEGLSLEKGSNGSCSAAYQMPRSLEDDGRDAFSQAQSGNGLPMRSESASNNKLLVGSPLPDWAWLNCLMRELHKGRESHQMEPCSYRGG